MRPGLTLDEDDTDLRWSMEIQDYGNSHEIIIVNPPFVMVKKENKMFDGYLKLEPRNDVGFI